MLVVISNKSCYSFINIMGKIGDFLRNRDRDPYPSEIYYDNKKQYRTKTGGIISLCFMLIVFVIISFKLEGWASQRQMQVTSSVSKSNFQEEVNVENTAFEFLLIDRSTGKMVKKEQLLSYGVNLTVEKAFITVEKTEIWEEQMVQCEDQLHFCIPPSYKFNVFGRSDVSQKNHTYQRIAVLLKTCSNKNYSCQSYKDNLIIYVFMYNNNINPNGRQSNLSQKQKRVFQIHGQLQLTNSIYLTFYLKKATFLTYKSLLPQVLTKQKGEQQARWFYDEQTTMQVYTHPIMPGEGYDIIKIFFKRSLYTHTHSRSFIKLETVLAQIFGLVGTVSLFLFCIYKGYNKWSFDQWKLEKLNKKNSKKRNLFSYYLSQLKCENNENEKLTESMDIYGLMKRVEIIEEKLNLDPKTSQLVENEDNQDRNSSLLTEKNELYE